MALDSPGSKWAPGFSCQSHFSLTLRAAIDVLILPIPTDGPVLTTTELYLLQTELQLNPILTNSNPSFHLIFHLQTGEPLHLVD